MEKNTACTIMHTTTRTVYCLLMLVFISCGRDDISSEEYYRDVPDVGQGVDSSDICISRISLTPVKVDNMETSFVGFFWHNRDTLYFSDLYYNYVYSLRMDGSVIKRYVGRGRGPGEVALFYHSVPLSDGYYLTTGSQSYRFDSKWNLTGQGSIYWGGKSEEYKRRINNPNPAETIFYGESALLPDNIQQWDSIHVAVYVASGLPKFNRYMNTKLYYNYSRIIALVNVNTGVVERIFGRRSPVFLEKTNIPSMDYIGFAQVEDKVYVTFRPDSSIYMLDKVDDRAVGKFGRQGRNMNTAYVKTLTLEEGFERGRKDMEIFGYYTYLKYDENRQLLFRGFTQGAHSQYDGLQIYKNHALIGDVDVPKGFYIVGYCNDQLIAAIDDKEIKELALYFYFVNFND